MINKLLWKLLRRHASPSQMAGFFLANLIGTTIILIGLLFYRDIIPLFGQDDGLFKKEYLVTAKHISTLGGLAGRSSAFEAKEINELSQQPFVKDLGAFTPSLFKVRAGVGMPSTGLRLSTDMFFESVPDRFLDVQPQNWRYDSIRREVPIIIPRIYLDLYNFGFAQSQGLPRLSENLTSMIGLDLTLQGMTRTERLRGRIVGFSNRLNTILIPQSFMEQANASLAPGRQAQPSRLIVEVTNPADPALSDFYAAHRYTTEGDNLDQGRATRFLRLATGIVAAVGGLICMLSVYILLLSIFLLIQKNSEKITNLLLIGYTPSHVARPYAVLSIGLTLLSFALAGLAALGLRTLYTDLLRTFLPQLHTPSPLPALAIGLAAVVAIAVLDVVLIKKRITPPAPSARN